MNFMNQELPIAPRRDPGRVVVGLALISAFTAVAFGHEEAGSAAGLVAGLHHPVSGWDHILAMVAVGLWGAQLGPPAVWVLPIAFPMVMALGGMLGLMVILAEARPPLWVAAVIVSVFAIFHGHAHGTELPVGSSGLLYSIGFVAATGALHGIGIAIGLVHRWKAGQALLRAAGGGVALGGGWFLWQALA